MAKPLVIVESPAKARTLARLLGDEYRVEASVGHIRDLPENASEVPAEIKDKPWGSMAIDVDNGFRPYYVVARDKAGRIRDLRAAVKDAPEVLLATDPDREGESISWHLREVLKPQVPVRRIVFHEITEEAIRRAIDDSRDIDLKLVDAQESRRIVDRLYGYMVSPVLWKKVQTGLSAGRVQSVAVRLVVEREEERGAFRSSAYWDLEARVGRRRSRSRHGSTASATPGWRAVGTSTPSAAEDRRRAAPRRGLRPRSGRCAPRSASVARDGGRGEPGTQRPSPPFTTSTLQQEANRKLGFSADRTMSAAQRLFTEGLISYHRTDSTTLSERALAEASGAIRDLYGSQYDGGPRQYRTTVKNAQEAHEAIRPTDFGQTPSAVERRVGADEQRLYDLVWKRAVASQMADARCCARALEITADGPDGPVVFSASGKAIQFAGFLRAYVEGTDDPAAELGDQETLLPKLSVGDLVTADGAACARRGGADRARDGLLLLDIPMLPSSSASRTTGSAGRRRMRRSSRRSSGAGMSGARARRSCRASRPTPSRASSRSTSPRSSNSGSPASSKRASTRSARASATAATSSTSSTTGIARRTGRA